jgi:hypothetical protein
MKKHLTFAIGAIALLLAGTAHADKACQWDGKHGKYMNADANKDGKVSRGEFLAMKKARAERKFARLDANGDGVLDEKDRIARFDRIDTNHDGVISRDEFEAHHKMMWKHGRK